MARKMLTACKKCLMLKNFKLHHDRPEDFVHSWLFASPLPYAIFATCLSLYTIIMAVVSGFLSMYGFKIFIWLTYWSFFTLTARFIVTAVNAWRYIFSISGRRVAKHGTSRLTEMPTLYKVEWLLQNMSNCSAITVAGLYWIILYTGRPDTFLSINSHALNSVLVMLDVAVSRAPVRVQHLVYTFLFMLLYSLFTVMYWAAGGTNHKGEDFIYPSLDYSRRPGAAVAMIVAVLLLAVPFIQLIVFALSQLRVCAHRAITSKRTNDNANGSVSGSGHSGKEADRRHSSNAKHKEAQEVVVVEKSYLTARLTSQRAGEEEIDEVDMDFEMDIVPHPPLLSQETAQISCTDSTNALLGRQESE